jgi:hypothetical protein
MTKRLSYTFLISSILVGCTTTKNLSKSDFSNAIVLYSTVFQINYEDGKNTHEGIEIAKYGYDSRNNLIENYDEKGLFLEYKYDSLNNLYEQNFYENYDPITGMRTPSSKWIYKYNSQGLCEMTISFKYQDSSWVVSDTSRYKYALNDKNQIVERKYFKNSVDLVWTEKSWYLDNAPTEDKPYSFDRLGNLNKHACLKDITYKADSSLLDSTTYSYDNYYRMVEKIDYRPGQKYPTVIKREYNNSDQLIKQSQYFGVNGNLFYMESYTYSPDGLILTETEYDGNQNLKWIKEHRY